MKLLFGQYNISISKPVIYIKVNAFLLLLFFSMHANAQKISAQVFNGWGNSKFLNGQTFDGSVGESGIITLKGGGFTITQGFLQPMVLKVPCGEIVLRTFPNPVKSGMQIYAEGCDVEVSSVQAYDLFGKLVYEGVPLENKVDLSGIGVGVYMVRALGANEQLLGVVKIIKTTI